MRDGEKRKEMKKEQNQNFLRGGISVVTAVLLCEVHLWRTCEVLQKTLRAQWRNKNFSFYSSFYWLKICPRGCQLSCVNNYVMSHLPKVPRKVLDV